MADLEFSEEDIQQLTLLAAKLMLVADQRGKSIAILKLDPRKMYNLPGPPGSGKLLIAVAGGPSAALLKSAIDLTSNPQ